MSATGLPFAEKVADALRRRDMTLRELCRRARLDPSFFSKVLAGKRSPPADEEVLRRVAEVLALDAAELIVAAGRLPAEWRALWSNPDLFRSVDGLARSPSARSARPAPAAARTSNWRPAPRSERPAPPPARFSEELL